MADIDVGTIGGSLELVDKSFTNVLSAGEREVTKFKSSSDAADEAIKRLEKDFDAVEKGVSKFEKSLKGSNPEILTASQLMDDLANEAIASINPWTALGTAITATATAVAAAGVAIGVAIGAAAMKAADLGDELLTMSKQTGVSVEALSAYRFVADQTGVSLTTIANGVSKFTADMGKGSKVFKEAIADVGLSLSELRNMKPEEALQKTLDALGKVPNAADRAALGTQIFGRQFKQLAGLIGEDVTGMTRDVAKFGGVVTTEMAVAGDMFNDAKSRIHAMAEAAEVQLGSVFVPAFAAAMKAVGDAWNDARAKSSVSADRMTEIVDKVVVFFIKATGKIVEAIGTLSYLMVSFFAADMIKDFKIVELLGKLGKVVAQTAEAISAVMGLDFANDLSNSIRELMIDVENFNKKAPEGIKTTAELFKDASISVVEFGASMERNAEGSVASMRKAIKDAADALDKANGSFKGLGETAQNVSEATANAIRNMLRKMDFNVIIQSAKLTKQFMKEQLDQANRTAKAQMDLEREVYRENEDTDRRMRRLMENSTRFELGEIQRRLDKQLQYYRVLEQVGVPTQKAIEAATRAASAEMLEVASRTKEFGLSLANVLSAMGHISAAEQIIDGISGSLDEATTEAHELAEELMTIATDVANAMANAFKGGGGFVDALLAGLDAVGGQISKALQTRVMESIKKDGMSWGAALGGIATFGLGLAIDYVIREFQEQKNRTKMREAAEALGLQFADAFGGVIDFRRIMRQAGVDPMAVAAVLTSSTPEMAQEAINRIAPQIAKFKMQMEGLAQAANGVNTLMAGVAMSFEKSLKDQTEALVKAHEAHQKVMKEGGATEEQLAADNDAFLESLKTHTFEATDAQIAAFNRVGTIAAGVIANTVNQTGNIVEAILAVKDTLGSLDEIRDKFALGDQINVATQKVLELYDVVTNNEDVFTSISGIGEVMHGLGNAIVHNSDLANAFGQQLAADFATLQERGVDANLALSMMAPQLQQLWELQKDGRIVIDETTKALLDQAEAAGIVGDTQRDVNERILDVLTEIKDLLGFIGNVAVPRVGTAATTAGHAVNRAFGGARSAVNDVADAAHDAQEALDDIRAPDPIKIDVEWNWDDPPWKGEWDPTPDNPNDNRPTESFAGGSGGFRNFTDGTPAMLHGLERVQTYAQYQNERAMGGNGGESPGVIVQVDGETLVAVNARNKKRWELMRTGTSPRTVR